MTSMTDPLRRYGLPPGLEDLPASVPAALQRRLGNGADPFVIGVDFRLTFAEADSQSAELAGRLLASGIGKGTRVGLLFANGPAWAVTWLALARIGALSVPLSTFAPGAELARMVRQTDIHALLMGATFGSERMTTRLESGLAGLARSPADLQLEDAPFLRWIRVEGAEAAQLVARPPGPARGTTGARGRVGGHSRRRLGDHQHLGCDGGPEVRAAHARVAGPSRRALGGAARADQRGPHLFADALLLGRRPHHGAARRPGFRGGLRRAGALRAGGGARPD